MGIQENSRNSYKFKIEFKKWDHKLTKIRMSLESFDQNEKNSMRFIKIQEKFKKKLLTNLMKYKTLKYFIDFSEIEGTLN